MCVVHSGNDTERTPVDSDRDGGNSTRSNQVIIDLVKVLPCHWSRRRCQSLASKAFLARSIVRLLRRSAT